MLRNGLFKEVKMLAKFSVKKPMTVFVAVVLVIVLGVVSFMNMTPNLLPNMDFPYVILMTTYPGARGAVTTAFPSKSASSTAAAQIPVPASIEIARAPVSTLIRNFFEDFN